MPLKGAMDESEALLTRVQPQMFKMKNEIGISI